MDSTGAAIDYHIDLSVGKAPHVAFSVDDAGIGRLIVGVTVAEPRAVLVMDLISTVQRTLRLGQTPARKTTWAINGFVGDELTTVAMMLTTLCEWVRYTMPPAINQPAPPAIDRPAQPAINQRDWAPAQMRLSAAARPFVPRERSVEPCALARHLTDVVDRYLTAPNSPPVDNSDPRRHLRMRNQVINLGRGRLDDMEVSIICAELVKRCRPVQARIHF